jgi:hypothetical protein
MSTNYRKNFNFLNINFYQENDKKFNPNKLSINISNMKIREYMFKNILYLTVKAYHEKFLKTKKIKIKYNPSEQKAWHYLFDPDKECEDIPMFEIPEPPMCTSVFENIINKNDIKTQVMKYGNDILNNINNNNKNKRQRNNRFDRNYKNNNNNKTVVKYVSEKFLNKLRMKEELNDIINEIQNYNLYHNTLKDMQNIYREILIQIKTILLSNKSVMKIKILAEMILNSNKTIKNNINTIRKMEDIIKKLNNVCKFFDIKNHSHLGLVVVLIDKNAKIPKKINYNFE